LFGAVALAGCGGGDTTPTTNDLSTIPNMQDMTTPPPPPADMTTPPPPADMTPPPPSSKRVIVFVWDGLRPDSITQADTPNLLALKTAGVDFKDNHSTYPTFTMMNAAAFATGSFPGTTGFYGNTLWQQGPTGNNSAGTPADFQDPIFTEDYAILQDLDAYYNNQLLLVGTLFQAAQAAGLKTAAVGKSGPAFLQDYKKGGWILDEKTVFPISLVQEIQAAGDPLPATTPFAYAQGMVHLGSVNGTPTSQLAKVTLADKITSDPTDSTGAPTSPPNYYMMQMYIKYILPKLPDLTLIWFRTPDSPEHNYGPGSPNYHDALRAQDALLGQLQAALTSQGVAPYTDIIIVSDHGHSSVSGPVSLFPLRPIKAGAPDLTTTDNTNGWSVSGDVRLADLMSQYNTANPGSFGAIYDGSGCMLVPVASGIKADGTSVYPTLTDATGTVCGKAGTKYTTASFTVQAVLPAKAVVIATNGGSDYIYIPDHDTTTFANVVKFLQIREEVGAIFVNDTQYPTLPDGTIGMSKVKLYSNAARTPDVIFSYNYDETQVVAGVPGIEFESMSLASNRGMHGSFGPTDVHNTLVAAGPEFKAGFSDTLPSGNVDVAPTVAKILGLTLTKADGRSLDEALTGGAAIADYTSTPGSIASTSATGLTFAVPTDPTGGTTDAGKTAYSSSVTTKVLTKGTSTWTYFDFAKAVRQ
jgi:arylsulfatase A-like enzyme